MKRKFMIMLSLVLVTIFTFAAATPINALVPTDIPSSSIPEKSAREMSAWLMENIPNLDNQSYTVLSHPSAVTIVYFSTPGFITVRYNQDNRKRYVAHVPNTAYVFQTATGKYVNTWYTSTIDLYAGFYTLVASSANFAEYECSVSNNNCPMVGSSMPINKKLKGFATNTGDIIIDTSDKTQEAIKDVENTIKDDTVDTGSAGGFFEGFESDTHGLTSIVVAPLETIKSIINQGCSPISAPLPYVGQNISLPCMGPIYRQYFGGWLTLWQVISGGIVAYKIALDIFAMVRGMKNPESDKVEVLDL